jgi:membrane protease YdiL (CAAX protease family)
VDDSTGIPHWALAFGAALATASFSLFAFLFFSAIKKGRVLVAHFGLPDLMAGTVFFSSLSGLAILSYSRPPGSISLQSTIDTATLDLLVILTILGFLKLRKISILEIFGLARVPLWKVPLWAGALFLGVFPLLMGIGYLSKLYLPEAESQEVVQFFQRAVWESNHHAVWMMIVFGAVIAPLAEELMFRGYLYGLCKRYAGPVTGILFNSVLFAAIHGNLVALPSLCALAVALTIAYELTGCLLVPIAMHALFNLTEFSVMLNAPSPAQ